MKLANCSTLNRNNVFLLSRQISMSALQILVHVTRTLIAPTVKVLTAVLVNKDSPEMVQLVKVSAPNT